MTHFLVRFATNHLSTSFVDPTNATPQQRDTANAPRFARLKANDATQIGTEQTKSKKGNSERAKIKGKHVHRSCFVSRHHLKENDDEKKVSQQKGLHDLEKLIGFFQKNTVVLAL